MKFAQQTKQFRIHYAAIQLYKPSDNKNYYNNKSTKLNEWVHANIKKCTRSYAYRKKTNKQLEKREIIIWPFF